MDPNVNLATPHIHTASISTPEGEETEGECLNCGAAATDHQECSCAASADRPTETRKRKRLNSGYSSEDGSRSPEVKARRHEACAPSPPSTSCDREVSIILTQSPLSFTTQYSATSSLHTDLAISPSPANTEVAITTSPITTDQASSPSPFQTDLTITGSSLHRDQTISSSAHYTDLVITPTPRQRDLSIPHSPLFKKTDQEAKTNKTDQKVNHTKIVQPNFFNLSSASADAFNLIPTTLYSSPILGSTIYSSSIMSSPMYTSPIISSPLYSPHSPGYSIPSPGSAFSIVSPRRRISCDSESEAVLGVSGVEMGGEGSEVKDTTGREVTEDMTVGKSDSPWPEIDMEESSLIDE